MDILEALARTVVVVLVLWPLVVLVARRRTGDHLGEVDTLPRPEGPAGIEAPDGAYDPAPVQPEDPAERWVQAG
ncbi:hypothetical protein [Cellulomonas marina]|nr:hypothetical protein [Cellulomonas marina]